MRIQTFADPTVVLAVDRNAPRARAIAIASNERFMPPPPILAPGEARRDELPTGSDDP